MRLWYNKLVMPWDIHSQQGGVPKILALFDFCYGCFKIPNVMHKIDVRQNANVSELHLLAAWLIRGIYGIITYIKQFPCLHFLMSSIANYSARAGVCL